MNVFDIIGPIMIGPSSSHTAGAVRIGQIAKGIFGKPIKRAQITFYGSFAKTYKGHGTDKAIAGGLIGLKVDNPMIKKALELAKEQEVEIEFHISEVLGLHPNTVKLELSDGIKSEFTMMAASIGGGNVSVTRLNHLDVSFTCEYHTLIVSHYDREGVVAKVANLLALNHINIAQMRTFRFSKGGEAVMTIETDHKIKKEVRNMLEQLDQVIAVTMIKAIH